MRFIHTSDWHLGQYFFGKSRALEHKKFLNWLLTQVSSHHVDAVIVAGDIFDTTTPPSYARELYFDFITELSQLNCQLVVLAGNHDSPTMVAESKQLLAQLNTHVIPVANTDVANLSDQVFVLNNQQGDAGAVICAVPFIRPRDVVQSQAGQTAREKQQQLQNAISEHYHQLFQQAKILAKGQLPIIGTGHLTTVGASTSDSVREIYIGTLDAFPANAFPNFDYLALGHIHQGQKVAKKESFRYCGSPIALSFDEAKQSKQVLLVNFDAKQAPCVADVKSLTVPCFQPMAMIKTNLANAFDDVSQLLNENEGQTTWLDIEINSEHYRRDIQVRISELLAPLVDDKKIEILLIRRSKAQRQALLEQQEKITLEELTADDVFQARLAQEGLLTDDNAKKERLTQLFKQALNALNSDEKTDIKQ